MSRCKQISNQRTAKKVRFVSKNPEWGYSCNIYFWCIFSPRQLVLIIGRFEWQIFFFYFLHVYSATWWNILTNKSKTAKRMDLGKSWVDQFHIIHTSFGIARAFPNFCRYMCKCSFLAVISKLAEPFWRWFYIGRDLN